MTARQALALLLAAVAALSAVGGAASWYLRHAVVEPQAFADRAIDALDREPVRDAVRGEISAQVLKRVPARSVPVERVDEAVDRAIDARVFRLAFRRGAIDVNEALFADADAAVTLRVDIADVLAPTDPKLTAVLPAGDTARLLRLRTDSLPVDTARAADVVDTLAIVLPPLACIALAAALLVATDRRRTLATVAIAAVVCGALLLLGLALGRSYAVDEARAVDGVSRAQARDAAGAVWSVYIGGLRTAALVVLAVGLVAAALTMAPWTRSRRRRDG